MSQKSGPGGRWGENAPISCFMVSLLVIGAFYDNKILNKPIISLKINLYMDSKIKLQFSWPA